MVWDISYIWKRRVGIVKNKNKKLIKPILVEVIKPQRERNWVKSFLE